MAETEVPLVLVTGASGYIAGHVVQQLLQSGLYRVRGTVRSLNNSDKVNDVKKLCPEAKLPLELVEADLMNADAWTAAVKDCTYVLHTASPLLPQKPKHPDDVLKPAIEGTLNVLKACRAAGSVKRVVVTSSIASMVHEKPLSGEVYTEQDWTNVDSPDVSVYPRSKTLAERAAWQFVKDLPEEEKFELAVINPGLVTGPSLCSTLAAVELIPQYLLERKMMMVPRVNYPMVDVRDVALAHIRAMTVPEAAGHRHITTSQNLWFSDMSRILSDEFGPYGYNVPTKTAPNFLIKLAGLFDSNLDEIKNSLGEVHRMDNSRLKNVLGVDPTDIKVALIDTGYYLIESGKVKKKPGYKGRKD